MAWMQKRRFIKIIASGALFAGVPVFFTACSEAPKPAFKGVDITGVDYAKDLPLTDQFGKARHISDFAGKVVAVFFGFTHCPDVCPTTLAQLAGAQKQWAALPAATRPRLLFVSADPERDSPQLVAQYAHAFHPDTLAATAALPQLQAFARALSLVFMKVPGASGTANDYSIDHSAALVLLDPQARMAGVVQPPLNVKGITADLETLTKTTR